MLSQLLLLGLFFNPAPNERSFKDRSQASQPPRLRATVRAGASQEAGETRQELCLAISPLSRWALESCGTGAGFLAAHGSGPDMAHFRLRYRAMERPFQGGWVLLGLQAGFAELEVGEDAPGFHFNSAGPNGLETAGPAAGASLRWAKRLRPWLLLFSELNGNLTYLPHAPQLRSPQSVWQPTLSFSLGLGF